MGKVTVFVLLSGMVLMVYGVFASLVSKTGSAVSAGVSSFADLQAEIVTNVEVQAANEKAAEAADALDEIDYGSLPLTQKRIGTLRRSDLFSLTKVAIRLIIYAVPMIWRYITVSLPRTCSGVT